MPAIERAVDCAFPAGYSKGFRGGCVRGLVALAVVAVVGGSGVAYARLAEPHEAKVRVLKADNKFKVKKDGSYEAIVDLIYEIIDDAGAEESSVAAYQFNTQLTRLEVLEASVETDGKTVPIPKALIETKPVASDTNALQELAQLKIHFPGLRPKSKIALRIRNNTFKAQVPGYFCSASILSDYSYSDNLTFEFDSELPLFYEANDPSKKLEIKSTSEKGRYRLGVRTKSPVWKQVLDEESAVLLPEDKVWISVATSEDWASVFKPVYDVIEKEVRAPLPPLFEEIAERARKEKSPEAAIVAAMTGLADKIRYVMERLDSSQDIFPRPLKQVASSEFGDCKDYSTSLTAILRKLGYEARVAFIGSSTIPMLPPASRLASAISFNHAIVKAKIGEKIYWLDPTWRKGFAGLMEENASRRALVLDETPHLEEVPPLDPKLNTWNDEKIYRVKGRTGAEATISARLSGLYALPFTGLALLTAPKSVDYAVLSTLYPIGEALSWKFKPYQLTSRRYEPLTFQVTAQVKDPTVRTTQGRGFHWDFGSLYQLLRNATSKRESALDLGLTPGMQSNERLLAGVGLQGQPIKCRVKSKWLDAERNIFSSAQGVRIKESVTLKQRVVSVKDLRSPSFASFQKEWVSCFEPVTVLYR